MTLQEAYLKAKIESEKHGLTLLVGCEDYGDFWGFDFAPPNFDEDNPHTWVIGAGPTTVNKKTGAVEELGSGQAIRLPNGRPVPIEQFEEYSVAV